MSRLLKPGLSGSLLLFLGCHAKGLSYPTPAQDAGFFRDEIRDGKDCSREIEAAALGWARSRQAKVLESVNESSLLTLTLRLGVGQLLHIQYRPPLNRRGKVDLSALAAPEVPRDDLESLASGLWLAVRAAAAC